MPSRDEVMKSVGMIDDYDQLSIVLSSMFKVEYSETQLSRVLLPLKGIKGFGPALEVFIHEYSKSDCPLERAGSAVRLISSPKLAFVSHLRNPFSTRIYFMELFLFLFVVEIEKVPLLLSSKSHTYLRDIVIARLEVGV